MRVHYITMKNFTFHNVSINTATVICCFMIVICFTFHNVSINTYKNNEGCSDPTAFTFHNVSINTAEMSLSVES